MSNKTVETELELARLAYSFESGVNLKDRVIRVTGDIEPGEMFDFIDSALSELERDSRKSIIVRINSGGGDVYEALAVVGRIESSKCRIITEGYGHIMSSATLVLACGDRRRMSSRAWLMAHESSYGVDGRHSDILDEIQQREREELHWAKAMSDFTNLPAKSWYGKIKKRNWYINAEEAKQLGVVDEIF